jgi:hypothetical protein
MPLCPQITNTPITVSLTADFTVTNVVPVLPANTEQLAEVDADAQQALIDAQIAQDAADAAAAVAASSAAAAAAAQASANTALSNAATAQSTANSAASAASAAQSTATTALANAATAYTAAVGSLQPSASTIVNASNQMTAINGGGITVYSGSSATTGARVVLNSAGLAGFNSSSTGPGNGATFSISASTGAAVFSGSVTGATITGSDLNIAGVFLVNGTTGVMTATSATVTGTINATSGYFGTLANGWSIGASGLTAVGTGNITGGSIVGTQFTSIGGVFSVSPAGFLIATAGTIGGLTLSGSSITSATGGFSVTSSGVLTAISGTIGGSTLASGSITGGIIQTSTGSASVSLVGSSNSVTFKNGGSNVGHIVPLSSNGVIMHYGATADGSGGTFPQMFVGSANASMFASSTVGIGVATGTGVSINGTTSLNNQTNYPGIATASGSTVVVVTTGSRLGFVSSSRKTKKNIEPLTGNFVGKLLSLEPVSFDWKDQPEDMPYRRNYGLIAEDVASLTNEMESIVNYNQDNEAVSISYDRLTVFLMLAIKELKAEIDQLKGE